MERDPYEILGVAPDASQRQITMAFLALAQEHRKRMLSDPAAYGEFEETTAAYHYVADPGTRRKYNEEHGLPPPPSRHENPGFLSAIDNMLPNEWYVGIGFVIVWVAGQVAHFIATGHVFPGMFNFVANGPEDYVIYPAGILLFIILARWIARSW
jgi:curved DNA-binding protein CbpA